MAPFFIGGLIQTISDPGSYGDKNTKRKVNNVYYKRLMLFRTVLNWESLSFTKQCRASMLRQEQNIGRKLR
jgi:hypothetical protein